MNADSPFQRPGSVPAMPDTFLQTWPTSGGDTQRRGLSDANIAPPLSVAWTFDECAQIEGGIVAAGFTAVFGDRQGKVWAVDARTGTCLWMYELEGILAGTAETDGQHVFVGGSRRLVCLELATGKEAWSAIPGVAEHPMIGSSGCLLHLGSLLILADQSCHFFNAETGEYLRELKGPFEPYSHSGGCANSTNIFIPARRRLLRVNLESLRVDGELDTNGKVSSGPVLGEQTLFYGSSRSTIEAVDLRSFESKWSFQVEDPLTFEFSGAAVESRPALSAGRLVFGGPDGNIYCLSAADGKRIWKRRTGECVDSPPLVIGNFAYILTAEGRFCALSMTDGSIVWQHESNRAPNSGGNAAAIAANRILIGWDRLYAFCGPAPRA